MNLYHEYFLPHFINCACGMKAIDRQRAKMVPLAQGKVLEIGMGSALNLKHYDVDKVEMIWGLEPSAGMRRKAQSKVEQSSIQVEWLDLPSESIPLDDDSADSVVLTYTLCTIADWRSALLEMKRVLKPEGQLIFSEHGKAPDDDVQKWQQRVNPMWKKLAGGCNLNRDIPTLIESVGFKIDKLEQRYVKGPKIATYQYYGTAHT
ncbi:MAG: ubiquinone/menaquinone biosynthesis C-methylase UbiE [Arenicella sp.]|jgi:ubiquinone/menaquinone biosynthesis C-methylase UbiE